MPGVLNGAAPDMLGRLPVEENAMFRARQTASVEMLAALAAALMLAGCASGSAAGGKATRVQPTASDAFPTRKPDQISDSTSTSKLGLFRTVPVAAKSAPESHAESNTR
jgi:hypothetical protein